MLGRRRRRWANITPTYGLMSRVCWELLLVRPTILANTKHLYNIYTMLGQRRRRWAAVV